MDKYLCGPSALRASECQARRANAITVLQFRMAASLRRAGKALSPAKEKERMLLHDLERRFRQWQRTRHAIRRLSTLDDYILHDMGIPREEIRRMAGKRGD